MKESFCSDKRIVQKVKKKYYFCRQKADSSLARVSEGFTGV